MKKISEYGQYRPEAATLILEREDTNLFDGKSTGRATLYQARDGSFFVIEQRQVGRTAEDFEDMARQTWHLTADEAEKWRRLADDD